jgi:hypothetical protein
VCHLIVNINGHLESKILIQRGNPKIPRTMRDLGVYGLIGGRLKWAGRPC